MMLPKVKGGSRELGDLEGGRPKSQTADTAGTTGAYASGSGGHGGKASRVAAAGRLSVVSALYDTTNKGYLDAEERKARELDRNGTGLAPREAVQLLRRQTVLEDSLRGLRKRLGLGLGVFVLVVLAMGGAIAGVVVRGSAKVERAVEKGVVTRIGASSDGLGLPGEDEALLQDAKTGKVVTTHAEGIAVSATAFHRRGQANEDEENSTETDQGAEGDNNYNIVFWTDDKAEKDDVVVCMDIADVAKMYHYEMAGSSVRLNIQDDITGFTIRSLDASQGDAEDLGSHVSFGSGKIMLDLESPACGSGGGRGGAGDVRMEKKTGEAEASSHHQVFFHEGGPGRRLFDAHISALAEGRQLEVDGGSHAEGRSLTQTSAQVSVSSTLLAVGESCTDYRSGSQCASGYCEYYGTGGKCICMEDYHCPNEDDVCVGRFCLAGNLTYGESCSYNDQCTSNTCWGGNCKCSSDSDCPDEHAVCSDGFKCLAGNLAYGESCTSNRQCPSNRCWGGKCKCSSDSHCPDEHAVCSDGFKCLAGNLAYGESCKERSQCASNNCNTSSRTCKCSAHSDCPNADDVCVKGDCLAGNLAYGESCSHEWQCASNECGGDDMTCKCSSYTDCPNPQHELCEYLGSCLPRNLAYGESCSDNDQCTSGTCDGSKCKCRYDSHCPNKNDICDTSKWPYKCIAGNLAYGKSCKKFYQCTSLECSGGTCKCIENYHCPDNQVCTASGGNCITPRANGQSCRDNNECASRCCKYVLFVGNKCRKARNC